MTAQLPPFSGPDALCPKCLRRNASSEYRTDLARITFADAELHLVTTHGGGSECLLRRCQGCGWAWLEQCADAGLAPQAAPQ